MMTEFYIRAAIESDIPALARIHVEGWRGAYGGIISKDYLDSLDVADRELKWREWFAPEECPVLMAYDAAGNPAGFTNFGKLRTPIPGGSPIRPLYTGEIYAIYILPRYWRQGLGRQLMGAAAAGLRDMKHRSLSLWVLEKNLRACEFYKSLGGQRCGKTDIEIAGTKVKEVAYGWRSTESLLIK